MKISGTCHDCGGNSFELNANKTRVICQECRKSITLKLSAQKIVNVKFNHFCVYQEAA